MKGILMKCPVCHRKMKLTKKVCPKCIQNMDAAKRDGRVLFYVVDRVNGKQVQTPAGNSIEKAKDIRAERRSLKNKGQLEPTRGLKRTFRDVLTGYLEYCDSRRDKNGRPLSSLGGIHSECKRFLADFGGKRLGDLTDVDLIKLCNRRRKRYAPYTIWKEISRVKSAVMRAVRRDEVPLSALKPFETDDLKDTLKPLRGVENARQRVLSQAEYERLEAVCPSHVKHAVQIGRHTGMRFQEVINLTWSKVDSEAKVIHLDGKDTKNGKPRDVPIWPTLATILDDIRKVSGLHTDRVVLWNGQPIKNFGTFRKHLKKACEKAGIHYNGRDPKRGFSFHCLRSGYITDLADAGVDESASMKFTGHWTRTMHDRYRKVQEKSREIAAAQYEAYLKSGKSEKVVRHDQKKAANTIG